MLAPADDDTPIPEYMTAAGRAIPVRYNGAVARMTFGPVTAARVRKWLAAGEFDVLHLHEPVTPSLGMLALWIADGPIVATFHTALIRSRPLQMAYPLVRQSLEKISARIAVSEDARRTLVEHMGGDAVVIPNGVYVDAFTAAHARTPAGPGTPDAPTIAFLGRLDEPRKGLPRPARSAVPAVLRRDPRRAVPRRRPRRDRTGRGPRAAGRRGGVRRRVPRRHLRRRQGEPAGVGRRVLRRRRPAGESFGIVLVEAMSAGRDGRRQRPRRVLARPGRRRRRRPVPHRRQRGPGRDAGPACCATRTLRARVSAHALEVVRQYDWSTVTDQVLAVYEMVVAGRDAPVGEDPSSVRGARLLELRRGRGESR